MFKNSNNESSKSSSTPVINPAKSVQTPTLPTKYIRDDGGKLIVNPLRGEKK